MSLTFDEYQKVARKTAVYSGDEMLDLCHWALGVVGEGGEIAEKVKRLIRDHNATITDDQKKEIAKEIGDVLWYLAALADSLGYSLDELAQMNVEKLRSRLERGVVSGSGDNR